MINVLIVTRNNPHALCSLLGSLMSTSHAVDLTSRVFIGDASDTPVIHTPHVSRLLARFATTYLHFTSPDVNRQRTTMLQMMKPEEYVLSLDDDLILVAPYYVSLGCAPAPCFGITVDTSNEKKYPDYEIFSQDPSAHAFPDPQAEIEPGTLIRDPSVTSHAATVGHMLANVEDFYKALVSAQKFAPTREQASLVDDAAATYMARKGNSRLCLTMKAWHTGNSNGWWQPWEHKRFAVNSLVERMMNERP